MRFWLLYIQMCIEIEHYQQDLWAYISLIHPTLLVNVRSYIYVTYNGEISFGLNIKTHNSSTAWSLEQGPEFGNITNILLMCIEPSTLNLWLNERN